MFKPHGTSCTKGTANRVACLPAGRPMPGPSPSPPSPGPPAPSNSVPKWTPTYNMSESTVVMRESLFRCAVVFVLGPAIPAAGYPKGARVHSDLFLLAPTYPLCLLPCLSSVHVACQYSNGSNALPSSAFSHISTSPAFCCPPGIACNYTGLYDYEAYPQLAKFGLVDYDWANAKSTWVNQSPMDCDGTPSLSNRSIAA